MSADTAVNTAANGVMEDGTPISTERFLTFSSDGLNIGVSTNYVIEIITNHAITMVPLVPDYVKGIINLRGQIIPIIDIRLRMGKPSIEYTNSTGNGYRPGEDLTGSGREPAGIDQWNDLFFRTFSHSVPGL